MLFPRGPAPPDIVGSPKEHTVPTSPPCVRQPVPQMTSHLCQVHVSAFVRVCLAALSTRDFPGGPDGVAFQDHKRGDSFVKIHSTQGFQAITRLSIAALEELFLFVHRALIASVDLIEGRPAVPASRVHSGSRWTSRSMSSSFTKSVSKAYRCPANAVRGSRR